MLNKHVIFTAQNFYKVTRIASHISNSGTIIGTMVPIVVSIPLIAFFVKI